MFIALWAMPDSHPLGCRRLWCLLAIYLLSTPLPLSIILYILLSFASHLLSSVLLLDTGDDVADGVSLRICFPARCLEVGLPKANHLCLVDFLVIHRVHRVCSNARILPPKVWEAELSLLPLKQLLVEGERCLEAFLRILSAACVLAFALEK